MGNCIISNKGINLKPFIINSITCTYVDYYSVYANISSLYSRYNSITINDMLIMSTAINGRARDGTINYSYNSSTGVITLSSSSSMFYHHSDYPWSIRVIILKGINS